MLKFVAPALLGLSLVACQEAEDPPELKQLEEEKAAVKALEDELKELRSEIAKIKVEEPEIPVEDLQKTLDDQKAEILSLNEELKTLTVSEKEAREKLEAYRKKYPLE